MARTACTVSVPVQYSYTSNPPMARTACTVSVPVQYSYTSTTLWPVRPVQSLSACTVQLYVYSPYGPYGLYSLSACTVQLYL